MTNAWTDIAKIVPMLSSGNREEVHSAARAIERKLFAYNLTWMDLALRIGTGTGMKVAAQPLPEGTATRARNGNLQAEGRVLKTTQKAALINFDDFGEKWIPLSAIIRVKSLSPGYLSYEIDQNFARKEGMCL